MREKEKVMKVLRDLQTVCEKYSVAINVSNIYPGVVLLNTCTDEYIAKNVIIDPDFYEAETIENETISGIWQLPEPVEVGCLRCEYPSEPCRGRACDHFRPRQKWFDDVEEEQKAQAEENQ